VSASANEPAAAGARVRLVFPEQLVREPVLARLTRRFDVEPNIRRASVEAHSGWIVCELDGDQQAIEAAVAWLEETGVSVERLGDVVES
jgi:ABC-type methionine transport system ATPase subunit